MKLENIKKKVTEIACTHLKQSGINCEENLFNYNVTAIDLLYFAMDIKNIFNVSLEKIFDKTNYMFLTISNLSQKIFEQLEK